jgi:hypothetical protein
MKTYGGVEKERYAFLIYNVYGSGQPETPVAFLPAEGPLVDHLLDGKTMGIWR